MFPSKKFLISALGLLLIVLGLAFYAIVKTKPEAKKVHYHAGFIVFQDGKKIDFSDIKYMDLEPCTKGNQKTGDDQLEKAHLHDNVGDVVHIEAPGAVWGDLFTNIKFPVDSASTSGYINGQKMENFQQQPINKDDSLVVFLGKSDESLLSQAPTKDYIEVQGEKSKTCGD